MKERGIIFDAESVRQILAGAKSQSRRVIKPQPPEGGSIRKIIHDWGVFDCNNEWLGGLVSRYQPGDRLYVKEAWQTDISLDQYTPAKIAEMCLDASYEVPWGPVQYADGKRINWDNDATPGRIRNALHMPKWAARIWLEVTAVRVEKLHAIDEDDLLAEGAFSTGAGAWEWFIPRWDAINRRRGFSFESNPFVWVISFKRRAQ